jgi:hypothetical protein
MWKIPTIEEVYNEYHKQTFYIRNGVYPRTIQDYSSLYADKNKVEKLKKFIEVLKRNRASIDWKLYILALAKVFQVRYDLKYLGSFAGNKIYRDYIKSLSLIDNETEIYNAIINSLSFLVPYLKESCMSFEEYFNETDNIIPLSLKHIYSGTISIYFYACFPKNTLYKWFHYPDDVFQELFQLSKNEFINTYILSHRDKILLNNKLNNLVLTLEKKFNKYF